MHILSINLNNIYLDNNFDQDDPVSLLNFCLEKVNFKNAKDLEKYKGTINVNSVTS